MWQDNTVTRQLGIQYPILQGPFGSGHSSVELAAAVSNAGGLGAYGAHNLPAEKILALIGEIRGKTAQPFNINLWVPASHNDSREWGRPLDKPREQAYLRQIKPFFEQLDVPLPAEVVSEEQDFDAQIEAILEARPAAFSFVFGIPSARILKRCAERGIVTIGAATCVAEALALEKAGVDMLVASGLEAGGHRPAFLAQPQAPSLLSSFALIPQIRDAVSIPLIAAGGIADRRGLLAATALGADAVQVGTAFLACAESGASQLHKSALRAGHEVETALTRVYTGRLARYIKNRLIEAASEWPDMALPYPFQAALTRPLAQAAATQGTADSAAMATGQVTGLIRHTRAAELIQSLLGKQ